jgi:hypothetical protein
LSQHRSYVVLFVLVCWRIADLAKCNDRAQKHSSSSVPVHSTERSVLLGCRRAHEEGAQAAHLANEGALPQSKAASRTQHIACIPVLLMMRAMDLHQCIQAAPIRELRLQSHAFE